MYINICIQKIPNDIFENSLIFILLFLDNPEILHKFLCTVKISYPVILQMWENISGTAADPHPFWTWWYLFYMLLSEIVPLNVLIILSDTFSDCFTSYIVCVCNHYHRSTIMIRPMIVITDTNDVRGKAIRKSIR